MFPLFHPGEPFLDCVKAGGTDVVTELGFAALLVQEKDRLNGHAPNCVKIIVAAHSRYCRLMVVLAPFPDGIDVPILKEIVQCLWYVEINRGCHFTVSSLFVA